MSRLKSSVGNWKLNWKTTPRGREGVAEVEVSAGTELRYAGGVKWRRDSDGIWIQLPQGVFGFDLRGELDDNGRAQYSVIQRVSCSEWTGVTASIGEGEAESVGSSKKAKVARVRAQMPGKIIRILVSADQSVQKDQPVIVMEAMKMENEIRAPQAGKVTQIKVAEGQAVETGADLLLIDSEN